MNPATFDVHSVTMRSEFFADDYEGTRLFEYTLTADEWVKLQRAHKIARWMPFTCPATWMSGELEALVCGLRNQKRICAKGTAPIHPLLSRTRR